MRKRPGVSIGLLCLSGASAFALGGGSLARRSPSSHGLASVQMARVPKVVAFDLDATLWYPEMYQLWGGGAPFKKQADGTLLDKSGTKCYMMGDTAAIIRELKTDPKWKDTKVAYCSCTDEPSWADECMLKFEVGDGITLQSAVDIKEIFKSQKTTHFKNIQKKTGIAFEDMIFYDNEEHNCRTVKSLGVHCVYTPRGMTREVWESSLADFAKRKS